jgi:hypothetical protein
MERASASYAIGEILYYKMKQGNRMGRGQENYNVSSTITLPSNAQFAHTLKRILRPGRNVQDVKYYARARNRRLKM